MRRVLRLAILAGLCAAAVAAFRALRRDADPLPAVPTPSGDTWPPLRPEPVATPDPAAPAPKPEPVKASTADPAPGGDEPRTVDAAGSFAEPTADGECPDGFPIKAKLSSKIFHSPGQLNYDRTTPDRCYRDAAAAEADGLRAAKR